MHPRIALSALGLRPSGGGVSTYIRELLGALPPVVEGEIVAAVQRDVVAVLPPAVTALPFPVSSGLRRTLAALRSLEPADLVHGLDATLPVRVDAPAVVTVHDLSVFDVPWTFSRRRSLVKRVQLRDAIRRADEVIAVSAFTASRLADVLARDAVVIPEATPTDCAPPTEEAVTDVRRRYDLPDRFVLHVGTIEPRKDVGGLDRACKRVGVPLVVVGAGSTSAGLGTHRLGYVPRADLNALYAAATIVAYPSRYEGFGLPPLEAMACGAVVVATRVGALPEVLGDAAVLVGPADVDVLSTALSELMLDEERRVALRSAGLARAESYSWSQTATATAHVYRSLGVSV